MSESFDFDAPDHFTAGAVGAPGQRVFYLQSRQARRVVTLKAEKEQVRALGDYLADLLAKLPEAGETAPRDLELIEPVEAAWAIGSIGLGWDDERQRVIIIVHEALAGEEVEEEPTGEEITAEEAAVEEEPAGEAPPVEEGASARFSLTRAQAAAFVTRAESLVKAGRPICPMCSQPKDPGGHICPRSNGHIVH
jgi:uncharacterized repeat protein (TIGR03847 family)